MTLDYRQMFHDATREHAESLANLSPMRQAIRIDDARHMRAPMHEGDQDKWERVECECGSTIERPRCYLVGGYWSTNEPDESPWRVERCDGSSCGTENCGRMLAKCGRCREK